MYGNFADFREEARAAVDDVGGRRKGPVLVRVQIAADRWKRVTLVESSEAVAAR